MSNLPYSLILLYFIYWPLKFRDVARSSRFCLSLTYQTRLSLLHSIWHCSHVLSLYFNSKVSLNVRFSLKIFNIIISKLGNFFFKYKKNVKKKVLWYTILNSKLQLRYYYYFFYFLYSSTVFIFFYSSRLQKKLHRVNIRQRCELYQKDFEVLNSLTRLKPVANP